VKALAWQPVRTGKFADEQEHPLGRIVGAVWHPGQRRLYVLDGLNGGVSVYDSAGERVGGFGRTGGGPGEFEELGGAHGARAAYNQITLLGTRHLAVLESGLLHVFEVDGRFVQRVRTMGEQAGPFAVLQLAGISDRAVLFAKTGAMELGTRERDERTALRLLQASLEGTSIDTAEFGRLRNNLNRLPPFDGFPPPDPYIEYYRRTWDAIPGVLAVASQFLPGVCFFDAGGRLLRVERVDAKVFEVDRAERSRVLAGFRRVGGERMPMINKRWEDHYRAWPATVPPYADLALAGDSVAWLERPRPGRKSVVDVYHLARGYLGSLDPPWERLPLAFSPGCAYVVEQEVPAEVRGENYFYGLERWCWPGAASGRRSSDP
jgi:hypothetical protein